MRATKTMVYYYYYINPLFLRLRHSLLFFCSIERINTTFDRFLLVSCDINCILWKKLLFPCMHIVRINTGVPSVPSKLSERSVPSVPSIPSGTERTERIKRTERSECTGCTECTTGCTERTKRTECRDYGAYRVYHVYCVYQAYKVYRAHRVCSVRIICLCWEWVKMWMKTLKTMFSHNNDVRLF